MKKMNCEQVLSACSEGKCVSFKHAHNTVTFSVAGKGEQLKITPSWPKETKPLSADEFRKQYHTHDFTVEATEQSKKGKE